MKVYKSFEEIEFNKNTILTVGTFDGVHLGHQLIINRFLEKAGKNKYRAVLLTFDPHPQIVLKKEGRKPIKLLTMIDERLELFEKFGLEHILIIPFSYEFSRIPPETFVKKYLFDKIGMKKILIGYDHMFGKDRVGNKNLLKELSMELDFDIERLDPLLKSGVRVSSTKIRQALDNNEIETANEMLGFNYFVKGKVIKGDGRGLKIGVPTANFEIPNFKQMPALGVYLVRTEIDNVLVYGMANIGTRPTFTDDDNPTFEANFFDFDKDIYNYELKVEFLRFIREENKFDGLESFLIQLVNDKKKSLEIIKKFYI